MKQLKGNANCTFSKLTDTKSDSVWANSVNEKLIAEWSAAAAAN